MGKSSGGVRGGNGGYPRATDSYEREVINLHKRQNVREIYDSFWQSEYVDRFGNGSPYELEGKGGAILQSVYDNGTGAAKDIAAKFIDPSRYEMSSKQKWAIAYAFKDLKPNQVRLDLDYKAQTARREKATAERENRRLEARRAEFLRKKERAISRDKKMTEAQKAKEIKYYRDNVTKYIEP